MSPFSGAHWGAARHAAWRGWPLWGPCCFAKSFAAARPESYLSSEATSGGFPPLGRGGGPRPTGLGPAGVALPGPRGSPRTSRHRGAGAATRRAPPPNRTAPCVHLPFSALLAYGLQGHGKQRLRNDTPRKKELQDLTRNKFSSEIGPAPRYLTVGLFKSENVFRRKRAYKSRKKYIYNWDFTWLEC